MNVNNVNITQIIIEHEFGKTHPYINGRFIPVFQDALMAIASSKDVTGSVLRVLCYLLAQVDDDRNHINVNKKELASALDINIATVYDAVNTLVRMNVLCNDGAGKEQYRISPNIINPRVAYRGKTSAFRKNALPNILSPSTGEPLIPGAICFPTVPSIANTEDITPDHF